MFWNIFTFELKYRFTRPATYIYFSLLAFVAFLLIASGNTPASEKVFHNAPVMIAELQLLISLFAIFLASAVMGVPLYRDLEHKTGTFMFSYPISESAYFMGRFWGSFVTLIFISLGVAAGIYLGSIIGPATGWTEAARFGPNTFINYFQPYFTMMLPNLWLSGTLFFALIVFTRNIKSIYSGGIIVFIVYLLANFLSQDIENKDLVQILDPFGLNSFNYQTRYLTAYEQNNFLLAVKGNLLANRLLWTGVGILFFVAAYFRFSFAYFFQTKQKKSKQKEASKFTALKERLVGVSFKGNYHWNSLITLSKIEVQNILKDVYFRSILLGGLVFLVIDFWIGQTLYSVPSHPVTSVLMEYKGFDYNIFVFIILVFFTGETLHRDKTTGYSKINDTFPVKDGVIIGSKFLGMSFVALILATLPILVGLAVQTLKGYHEYHLSTYLIDCYLITFPDYLQMIMLVFAVHLLVNNKFAGHATSIGIWLIFIVLRQFANYDFNLFFYSYKPNYRWSEMNGLGHFGEPLFWFNIYWTLFGISLVLFFSIFYSRGTENNFKKRIQNAKSRLFSKWTVVSYFSFILALVVGAYIYNNVVYVNTYLTNDESLERQAHYEKQLKQYEFMPQPKIIDIKLAADLFPKKRAAYFDAQVTMVNKTDSPIDSLHLAGSSLSSFDLIFEGKELNYRFPLNYKAPKFQIFGKGKENEWYKIYKMPFTLQPGDTIQMQIKSSIVNKGFANSGFSREIVYNGTFIGGGLPEIGYNSRGEISSDEKRREYDLPEKDYELPPHDDPYGRRTLLFADEADLISFEATVSTSSDQIAIAPGYIQKEWTEGDRRYFHYIQDTPIQAFFNIVSADYEVHKDEATLPDGQKVAIEIYYHDKHDYNLDRFKAAYKDGLTYFSETYGNFQFRQMRLLEFPRYAGFAQSFPNTVPFSESFGWLADFDDPNSFDYTYYVTAHELAHQWWGHQITPNYTRGSNLISEALAEYSALVLTERKYGKDNMKRFLKDELDDYLRGRSGESKKENTFINCNRSYQWYKKGSLILYGLRDLIGPEAIDSALKEFRDEFALREEPPYPGSSDLFRYLKKHTPDSLQYYLDDTWNKITLYENKTNEATAELLADSTYKVTLNVSSSKLYADSLGMETAANYEADYIDVGVFAADETDENGRTKTVPLYLKKHKLAAGEHTIEIIVKEKPVKAGIDPLNKLIDRIPDDNTQSVSLD
ncbi:M1 family aminopeptidase [Mangrovivirga sp. M17]|uniref:M1 family aminopeptidase n=1 Tax=Mangrovivirga halotolerans TaxID=2993936 RepID=A0ABT3RUJ3_9BACT|nr:M1 family aminopeptidase [Mangrovivirga halotolerans]MCX2745445.1 M1 family aminopeptidase [Mangrovivirga halotolerans]